MDLLLIKFISQRISSPNVVDNKTEEARRILVQKLDASIPLGRLREQIRE